MAEMGTTPDTMRLGGAVLKVIDTEGCPFCGSIESSVDIESERFQCTSCGARCDALQIVFHMDPSFFYGLQVNLLARVRKLRRLRDGHCRE